MSKTREAWRVPIERPQSWGKPTKGHVLKRPWYGLDTERDHEHGEYVCGYACNPEEVQDFFRLDELKPGTYWIWNLPYDIEGMIREYRDDDAWAMRMDAAQFSFQNATCRYFHGKRFDWKDPTGRRVFLEASSFYGRQSLERVASKVLGYGKAKDVDSSSMSLDRYYTDPVYKIRVEDYCKRDALLVLELIERLDVGFKEVAREMGIQATIGTTPGATARRFMAKLGPYPKVIWRTHKPFLRCYGGGRFELTKLGRIPDVYQYDITSAYAWAQVNCPWLTDTAKHRFTRVLHDDVLFGSYCVGFETDEYLGLAPTWKGTTRVYSRAEEKTWLTKLEVDWLQDNGYDYTIYQGVEVWDENATDAWADFMREPFRLKQENPGTDIALGAKGLLTGTYGVQVQLTPHSGKWVPMGTAKNPTNFAGYLEYEPAKPGFMAGAAYAPIYASYLTAFARVQLLNAARSLEPEHYIGGHTDSILCTQELKCDVGEGLGKWVMEGFADDFVITKTGVYAMDDKVKNRGVGSTRGREALWAEYQMRNTRVGVKQAKSWDEVSVIKATPMRNNIGVDQKRAWRGDFDSKMIENWQHVDSDALCYVGA